MDGGSAPLLKLRAVSRELSPLSLTIQYMLDWANSLLGNKNSPFIMLFIFHVCAIFISLLESVNSLNGFLYTYNVLL